LVLHEGDRRASSSACFVPEEKLLTSVEVEASGPHSRSGRFGQEK